MKRRTQRDVLLVALGGNALIRKGEVGTVEDQFRNLAVPVRQIARLSKTYRIIITHGNGPQVGNLLLQQECCHGVPPSPLEILVAQTQGQIGYMIESTLDAELMKMGVHTEQPLISLISYVVVDENDPAFQKPSKPIGPVFDAEKAATLPYPTMKTTQGYRRVVASPRPITIVEKREIRILMDMGFIVICCGGGGIPVIREGRAFEGVDAVIYKDLFLIASDVEGVFIHYGTPKQKHLRKVTTEEALGYLEAGHFPPGSMGPKVEAAVKFIKKAGKRALITSIDKIEEAVAGRAGTEIAKRC
jgi:carbamate kinase